MPRGGARSQLEGRVGSECAGGHARLALSSLSPWDANRVGAVGLGRCSHLDLELSSDACHLERASDGRKVLLRNDSGVRDAPDALTDGGCAVPLVLGIEWPCDGGSPFWDSLREGAGTAAGTAEGTTASVAATVAVEAEEVVAESGSEPSLSMRRFRIRYRMASPWPLLGCTGKLLVSDMPSAERCAPDFGAEDALSAGAAVTSVCPPSTADAVSCEYEGMAESAPSVTLQSLVLVMAINVASHV